MSEAADVLVSFRMPAALIDELKMVAHENDRTLSSQARVALREWLASSAATVGRDAIPPASTAPQTDGNRVGRAAETIKRGAGAALSSQPAPTPTNRKDTP